MGLLSLLAGVMVGNGPDRVGSGVGELLGMRLAVAVMTGSMVEVASAGGITGSGVGVQMERLPSGVGVMRGPKGAIKGVGLLAALVGLQAFSNRNKTHAPCQKGNAF